MEFERLKAAVRQEMEAEDTLSLYIYSEIRPSGWDWWTGEKIESETSAEFIRQKVEEKPKLKQLNLYINTTGGSVKEAYGIIAQIMRCGAQTTAYVDGFANSAGSLIAVSCDKTVGYVNSVMGVHNMMDFCMGNAPEHRQCADALDKLMEGNRQIYLQKSGGKLTLDKITELLDAETYITAQECLDYGLFDEILKKESENSPKAESGAHSQAAQMMQAQANHFRQMREDFMTAMNFTLQKEQGEPKKQQERQSAAEFNLMDFITEAITEKKG